VSDDDHVQIRILDGHVGYQDGSEDRILELLRSAEDRSAESDELASRITDWPSRYHLSRQRANLLRPLCLGPGLRILEIGAGTGVLSRYLAESGAEVVALEGHIDRARATAVRCAGLDNVEVVCGPLEEFQDPDGFDLVCIVGVLEYSASGAGAGTAHQDFLDRAASLRRPGGALLVAIENQIGIKYLLGYREDHLGLPWIGVEGYPGDHGIRTFSRRVLGGMLADAGLPAQTWFYPFPDYKLPSVVLTDAIYDLPDAANVVDQMVRHPIDDQGEQRSLICNDRLAHRVLLEAGVGRDVANSFMVVATAPGELSAVLPEPEILAWRLGDDRSRRWRRRLALRRGPLGLVIHSLPDPQGSAVHTAGWLLHDPIKDEPYVEGKTVEQLALDACDHGDAKGLEDALASWRWFLDQELTERMAGEDVGHPFLALDDDTRLQGEFLDVALSNFVLGADGIHFIDREWQAHGGVASRLVMARALWLFARDVIRTGVTHPWSDETNVDGLATRLGELCGVDVGPNVLESMRAAEVELQHVVTGRPRGELASDLEWLARQSRVSVAICAALPLTRLREEVLGVAERLREVEKASRRREAELSSALAQARDSTERLRGELAFAREHLDGTVRELANHKAELDSARAEIEMWRAARQAFERKLPVRLYHSMRRLLGR
jgi:2-polyprenyl-3-methyl-5-hydroxy-6-metoxy-1,4-benzoquinol methylase